MALAIVCTLLFGAHPCQDAQETCTVWASAGECRANPNFMLQFCMKSCGTCPGTSKTTVNAADTNVQADASANVTLDSVSSLSTLSSVVSPSSDSSNEKQNTTMANASAADLILNAANRLNSSEGNASEAAAADPTEGSDATASPVVRSAITKLVQQQTANDASGCAHCLPDGDCGADSCCSLCALTTCRPSCGDDTCECCAAFDHNCAVCNECRRCDGCTQNGERDHGSANNHGTTGLVDVTTLQPDDSVGGGGGQRNDDGLLQGRGGGNDRNARFKYLLNKARHLMLLEKMRDTHEADVLVTESRGAYLVKKATRLMRQQNQLMMLSSLTAPSASVEPATANEVAAAAIAAVDATTASTPDARSSSDTVASERPRSASLDLNKKGQTMVQPKIVNHNDPLRLGTLQTCAGFDVDLDDYELSRYRRGQLLTQRSERTTSGAPMMVMMQRKTMHVPLQEVRDCAVDVAGLSPRAGQGESNRVYGNRTETADGFLVHTESVHSWNGLATVRTYLTQHARRTALTWTLDPERKQQSGVALSDGCYHFEPSLEDDRWTVVGFLSRVALKADYGPITDVILNALASGDDVSHVTAALTTRTRALHSVLHAAPFPLVLTGRSWLARSSSGRADR